MARNGSGTYVLPVNTGLSPRDFPTQTWNQSVFTDIGTALTGSVAADGQTAMAGNLNLNSHNIANLGADLDLNSHGLANVGANLNFNSHKGTNLTNASAATDAAAFGQVPRPGCMLNRTSGFTLSHNSVTAVTWQAAAYDNYSLWSAGSPTRITIPAGVTYARFSAGFDEGNLTVVAIVYVFWFAIYKGGADFLGRPSARLPIPINGVSAGAVIQSAWLPVSAADYFETVMYQSSGGNQSIANTTLSRNGFWMTCEVIGS